MRPSRTSSRGVSLAWFLLVTEAMMRRRRFIDVLVLGALAAAATVTLAGCSSDTTSVTTPSVTTSTETFSGSLTQSSTVIHAFSVTTKGSVTVSLTAVSPLSTMALGVSLGSWSGTTCSSTLAENKDARSGATALTGTAASGDYCVRVYDSGNVPSDWTVAYTVDVVHP
jgi:hypothetical protein